MNHRVSLLAITLLGVWSPSVCLAQVVTGSVVDATTAAPLQGVLVSLLASDGERVRAVLSDDAGAFHFDVGRFGRYRIRAERIGLEPTTSETFDLFSMNPSSHRITMGARAIAIAGLVVDSRVQQCRVDRGKAVQIQRWWQEVRTALDVSSVVQGQGLAQFQVERFERLWSADLERVLDNDSRKEMSLSNRPFVSAEADFLSSGGFVQGDPDGQREYYAPDAEVLLSSTFLSEHCFSLRESDEEHLLGLGFEPTRDKIVPEIRGTLWVDTTTAELKSLEYRYTNIDDLPDNESGGFVSFEYLPSGAWVVGDWYIRMPKVGIPANRPDRRVLVGYVDVGGRVELLPSVRRPVGPPGATGVVTGVVYDSIGGRGLAGAQVAVLGTDAETVTDLDGGFTLTDVPVGTHNVTFFHDDPEAWGLGAPFVEAVVVEGGSTEVRLALPGFRQAARIVCMGSGNDAETVLLGVLVDVGGRPLGNVQLELTWNEDRARSDVDVTHEARTGSDGRFVVCSIPGETLVHVAVHIRNRWVDVFEVTLPAREIVFRRMIIPRAGVRR